MYLFIAGISIFFYQIKCETWNYADLGPDVWSDTYPACARHSQSPINIRTACTTYEPFTPFRFSSNYSLTHDFTLTNNGHSIIGRYNGSNSSRLILTGGGLDGNFQFLNFHLHWGENYKSGSEHQV
jgi:carbonic anhydrase